MTRKMTLLLCMILVLSLCACGNTQPTSDTSTSAETTVSSETAKAEEDSQSEPLTGEETSQSEASESEESQPEASIENPESDNANEPDAEVLAQISELSKQYSNIGNDELTWDYNSSTRTLIISGKGPMKDYFSEEPAWNDYCDEAVCVVIGDEVTSVSNIAFWNFTALTELKLGASVEFIGDYAFQLCTDLRTVNFPDTLKYVGNYAFCDTLLHSDNGFLLPEGLIHVGDNSFFSAFKESFVSIPASLVSIGTDAFANVYVEEFRVAENNPLFMSDDKVMYSKDKTKLMYYPAMKSDKVFEVPQGVASICREAIEVNNYLEKLVIPASVTNIDEGAIYWNYGLKNIEVDDANQNYMSVDGVLYTKDGKNLVCYPIANERTEYSVMDGCERICNYAMSSANNLAEIHQNDCLNSIGFRSLAYCNSLVKIGLSETLERVEDEAFMQCNGLSEVCFAGTADKWNGVYFMEGNDIIVSDAVSVRFEK